VCTRHPNLRLYRCPTSWIGNVFGARHRVLAGGAPDQARVPHTMLWLIELA
jgi:hypothetical protein